jgi:hypothetical protein
VHQIKLNPVSGEFEQAAGFFGGIFDVSDFACLLDDRCLSFATRHDGVPDNKTATTSTSMYPASLFLAPSSIAPKCLFFLFSFQILEPRGHSALRASVPANVGSTSDGASAYPGSLGFNDCGKSKSHLCLDLIIYPH